MVTQTIKATSLTSAPIFLKQTSSGTFSANYVIHAYEQGKRKEMKDKISEIESEAKHLILKNRDYTIEAINNLVIELITDGIIAKKGWIKSESSADFDVIIAVPQDDYYSDNFEKFYVKANEIETKSNNHNFHLHIRFINDDKNINEELLKYDGYKLKFEIQLT